ncbi:MAG: GTP 3',8-cyclase MoaA [Firmicutes bacterium HGW-Firmicutes-16]|nr:MAG: GTP 3',8-cyclase MoaA [Firmicutes bacterium HGW-Firmicutes-16]
MIDSFGRTIDYVRVSVTDRCDLRCFYCMPENGIKQIPHSEILRFEEIVRIVRLLAKLGIKKVRLTGGEPLVRKGLPSLVREIKNIDGIEKVHLTTNGMLLTENLPSLVEAGLDGINISLDSLSEETFEKITHRSGVNKVLRSVDAALSYPELRVKINCVPSEINRNEIIPLTRHFLQNNRLSLRFIEMMPIGLGKECTGIPEAELAQILQSEFGELSNLPNEVGGGPSRYYKLGNLPGRVGFISAVSHAFCSECDRIRLTASGFLKTCLQYDTGEQLRPLLELSDEDLLEVLRQTILNKPERHCFSSKNGSGLEQHIMSQIGG